jgi:hypothetical protein
MESGHRVIWGTPICDLVMDDWKTKILRLTCQ